MSDPGFTVTTRLFSHHLLTQHMGLHRLDSIMKTEGRDIASLFVTTHHHSQVQAVFIDSISNLRKHLNKQYDSRSTANCKRTSWSRQKLSYDCNQLGKFATKIASWSDSNHSAFIQFSSDAMLSFPFSRLHFVTARKRSCGKVMLSQVFVCPRGVGPYVPTDIPPWRLL